MIGIIMMEGCSITNDQRGRLEIGKEILKEEKSH